MGNLLRKLCPAQRADEDERDKAASDAEDGGGPVIQEVARPRLDPKDFMVERREGETVVREPGQVQGQQFIVGDCTDCDIFLLDNSAQVTVDVAVNCRIFVGPCESSVFFRDCRDCKVVVACQQLRLRDCENMDMLVHVTAGQPSIETSTGVRLGCFQFSYFSLAEQFRAANLSVWNTQWSNVHDFNPPADGEAPHWSFLPPGTDAAALGLRPVPEVSSTVTEDETRLASAVPATWGSRPLPGGARRRACLAVVYSPDLEAGFRLLEAAAADLASGDLVLVRTREAALAAGQLRDVTGQAPPSGAAGRPAAGLEFDGTAEAVGRLAEAAAALGPAAASFVGGHEAALAAARTLFEELAHVV